MQSSGHNIFVIDDPELSECSDFQLLNFCHPKHGSRTLFVRPDASQYATKIFELQTMQPYKYGSWFINQRVSSDSCVYLATPFDMRFLCIPFLVKMKDKYSVLDQIIPRADDGVDRIPIEHAHLWHLEEVCDVNRKFEDMVLYKYNEEKTLALLNRKVTSIADALLNQKRAAEIESCSVSSFNNSSSVAGFNNNNNNSSSKSSEAVSTSIPSHVEIIVAIQIISEYISDDLVSKLCSKCGIDEAELKAKSTLSVKRKAQWELDLELERQSMEFMSRPALSGNGGSSNTSSNNNSGNSISSNGKNSSSKPLFVPPQKKATQVKPLDNKTPNIKSFFMKK